MVFDTLHLVTMANLYLILENTTITVKDLKAGYQCESDNLMVFSHVFGHVTCCWRIVCEISFDVSTLSLDSNNKFLENSKNISN